VSIERIKEVPVFHHDIDEYELSQMSKIDAYVARNNSELKKGIAWNNRLTVVLNNAIVDMKEKGDRKDEEFQKQVRELNARLDQWEVRIQVWQARIKSPLAILSFILLVLIPVINMLFELIRHVVGE
jgi:hypothetical protein